MGNVALPVALGAAALAFAIYAAGYIKDADRPEAQPSARAADLLQEIAKAPLPSVAAGKGWTEAAFRRLRALGTHLAAVEALARSAEHEISTPASGCRFVQAMDDIAAAIAPARLAVDRLIDALSDGAARRARQLADEDAALGWVGWRGSRRVEREQVLVLWHDVAATKARADLAFTRLRDTVGTAKALRATYGSAVLDTIPRPWLLP